MGRGDSRNERIGCDVGRGKSVDRQRSIVEIGEKSLFRRCIFLQERFQLVVAVQKERVVSAAFDRPVVFP